MGERACGSCAWFDTHPGSEFGTCREGPAQVYLDHNNYTHWAQPRTQIRDWCSRFALELTAEKEGEGDE